MLVKRTLWRLDSPIPCPWAVSIEELAATHIKFIHTAYEAARDDQVREAHTSSPVGNLYALFAHAKLIDGVWTELRDWAGIEMRLDVAALADFCSSGFAKTPTCWREVDLVLLGAASDRGLFPPGRLVNERGVDIVFAESLLLAAVR